MRVIGVHLISKRGFAILPEEHRSLDFVLGLFASFDLESKIHEVRAYY